MSIEFDNLHYKVLGVVGSAFVGQIISSVWFLGFQRQFLKYCAHSEDESKKIIAETNVKFSSIWSFISKIITSIVFAWLAHSLNIMTIGSAILLAVIVWFGFQITVCVNEVIWHGEKIQYYALTQGCFLFVYTAMGAIYSLVAL